MADQASQVEKKQKQYAQQNAWAKDHAIRMNISFTNNSGIPQALKAVCEQTGTSETQYVRNAVIQALQWDGFNPEDHKPIQNNE